MKFRTAIALLLACCNAAAQTVYKCPGDDGTTIYSQRPCSTDESKVEQIRVRAPAPPGAMAGDTTRNASRGIAREKIANIEAQCINAAIEEIISPSNERVSMMEAEIRRLEARAFYSTNSQNDVAPEGDSTTQVDVLRRSIEQAHAKAERLTAMARQRCAEDRLGREAELLRRESVEDETAASAAQNEGAQSE